jgi:phenylacetate-CoA ligase
LAKFHRLVVLQCDRVCLGNGRHLGTRTHEEQADLMTSLAEERAVQSSWHRRSRGGDLSGFDRYLENEFLPLEEQCAGVAQALSRMFQFAATRVAFYREHFHNSDVPLTDGLSALANLPILSKKDVQDHAALLRAETLPTGEVFTKETRSSGSTGKPTIVQRCATTDAVLVYQKQREYRWFRVDPAGHLAYIRFAYHFTPNAAGEFPKDGEVVTWKAWPQIGEHFTTGPHCTFNITSPIAHQLEFLRKLKPDYLMSLAESLEHLALAAGDAPPCDNIKGLVSISEQMTSSMRRKIERSFGAPVRQNYGLNEIGLVAAECEAGRMHVHSEHCWVEIVNADGGAVRAGEIGRLLVSSLNNFAMPLFRYDTGDLAMAADGPCACGRTLPSFSNIVGRYSRIAFLPEGTLPLVGALREGLETAPASLLSGISLFQIHQRRDRSFELRLVSERPLTKMLLEYIARIWSAAQAGEKCSLRVVRTESLLRAQGGKFQAFTSDFMPPPDPPV